MMDGHLAPGVAAPPPPCPADQGTAAFGPSHVVRGPAGGHLRSIHDPAVTLAVWERGLAPALLRDIDRFPPPGWPGLRIGTTADTVRGDLAHAAPRRLPGALAADIVRLVRLYTDLVATRAVTLRLEAVGDDGCAYFHADWVGLRLLCTYRGAGTQWLPDAAVNRSSLGGGDNAAIAADATAMRALAAGHVALLKGEAWPGNRGRGLVHRSPPADRTAPPRLLLALDHEID